MGLFGGLLGWEADDERLPQSAAALRAAGVELAIPHRRAARPAPQHLPVDAASPGRRAPPRRLVDRRRHDRSGRHRRRARDALRRLRGDAARRARRRPRDRGGAGRARRCRRRRRHRHAIRCASWSSRRRRSSATPCSPRCQRSCACGGSRRCCRCGRARACACRSCTPARWWRMPTRRRGKLSEFALEYEGRARRPRRGRSVPADAQDPRRSCSGGVKHRPRRHRATATASSPRRAIASGELLDRGKRARRRHPQSRDPLRDRADGGEELDGRDRRCADRGFVRDVPGHLPRRRRGARQRTRRRRCGRCWRRA
jgi:hypothetical protein